MNSKLGWTGVSILFVVATLAACGGGGDGGGSAAAPPPNNSPAAPPPNNSLAAPPPNNNVAGFAYVANFNSDNVSAFTIDASTGALTAVAGSPFFSTTGPYGTGMVGPYSVAVDPTGKFAYVTNPPNNPFPNDVSVSAFTINAATGALTAVEGSPFHAAGKNEMNGLTVTVDPSGKFAYVVNRSTANVSAWTINATTGALTSVEGSPFATGGGSFPGSEVGPNPISIAVDPSGKFAYVTNASSANLSAFTINAVTGALTLVAGSPFATGSGPYSVAVDPSGEFVYVANQNSNNVSAFTINVATGALTAVAASPFDAGTYPASVTVDPSGKFAYVANLGSANVSAFTINAATGALTAVAGSPFATGTGPRSVAVDFSGKFAYVTNGNSNDVSAFTINASTGALTAVAGSPFAAGMAPWSVATTGKIK